MFGLQTLSCLHDIPVIRSSTDKLQDVYAKAKDTSVLVRLPCNLAETVADKSLKVALAVVNPLVKPFSGPVRVIDEYAVQKIRQIETKYPVIKTRPEDMLNSFNEKTEPVRNAMNSVKDTTAATLQNGTGSKQQRYSGQSRGLVGFLFTTVSSLLGDTCQTVQSSVIWFRMLCVFVLLKVKLVNDQVLKKVQHKFYVPSLLQQLLVALGGLLDYVVRQVKPDDRTLTELRRSKQQPYLNQQQQSRYNQQQQQPRYNQQQQYYTNQQSVKTNPQVTTRQSVFVSKPETSVVRNSNSNHHSQPQPDYSNLTDREELYARLANADLSQSTYDIDNEVYTTDPVDLAGDADIAQLHARLHPTDVELLYSRLPVDIVPDMDNQEPLNPDQQQLHARIIANELENQGYPVDD